MEGPLTKSQLCWVVIRFVGVYLLVQALVSLFAAVSSLIAIGFALNQVGGGAGPLSLALPLMFSTVASGVVGLYLLFRGGTIHRLMMVVSEPSDFGASPRRPKKKVIDPDDEIDPATTLSRREAKEYAAWLGAHPELQTRSETDRIALFRDAQASGEG